MADVDAEKGGISMNPSKWGGFHVFTFGLLLALIFSPNVTYSNNEAWQRLDGPWGREFESSFDLIRIDPTDRNTIYLANGAGAGIYKSFDGGVNWNTANKGLPKQNSNYFPITGIFVNPSDPTTIYSSTATPFPADPWQAIGRGVFKSKADRVSWKKSNGKGSRSSLPKEGEGVFSIFRLVGDPNHPDTLYTAHAFAGVYKSTDGGATWLEKNNGLPIDPAFGLHVNALEVDPSNTSTLYAAPYINYPISYLRDKGPQAQGIYRTADGGDHWIRLDTGSIIPPLPWDLSTFVTCLKVSPHDSNTIYFGTSNKGLFKSSDGGTTWTDANGTGDNRIPQDLAGYYQINCLVLDPIRSQTIYAGLNNGGVYKSDDGGANWSSYNNGLDEGSDVNDLSIAFDKLYATTSEGVYARIERGFAGEGSAYGGVIKFVLEGIASGAVGEVGSLVMGQILDVLGWGDKSHQEEMDALNGMKQTLDQIVAQLSEIQSTLSELYNELKIDEDEILINANNPKEAIGRIHSAHDELSKIAAGKGPGDLNKQEILDNIAVPIDAFNSQMKQDVNSIKYAILPLVSPIPGKSSVLDNYLNLALDQIKLLHKDPIDAYNGMELYFSQLLFYQLEGVNLIIEAKNAKQKAGRAVDPDAEAYWNDYKANTLNPQVDKFMKNVYRMILMTMTDANLLNSSAFLPQAARPLLARANFFRVQCLNLSKDHYGLRGTLIGTQDLVSSMIALKAKNKNGQTYSGKGTAYAESGKTYDHWSGRTVTPSPTYTIVEYDFGEAPIGDYDILDDNGNALGSATVQAYKDDYTVDPSGKTRYGHCTMQKRIGAVERFSGSDWKLTKDISPSDCVDVSQSPFKLKGQGFCYGKADESNSFTIGTSDPIRIYFAASVSGFGEADCYVSACYNRIMGYNIWLWDATDSKEIHVFDSGEEKTSRDSRRVDFVKTLDPKNYSFIFSNPQAGHTYWVFSELSVDGGSSEPASPRKTFVIATDPISIGLQYFWSQTVE